jgi:hypothetical protein
MRVALRWLRRPYRQRSGRCGIVIFWPTGLAFALAFPLALAVNGRRGAPPLSRQPQGRRAGGRLRTSSSTQIVRPVSFFYPTAAAG